MAHQEGLFAAALLLLGGKIRQVLHQVGPVVADGVFLVMAIAFDGADAKAALAQVIEQHAVGAGGETVGVGENDAGHGTVHTSLSRGVVIFLMGRLRRGSTRMGTSVTPPFHAGSSMLSNTWRSFSPQLSCSMRK